MNTLIEKSDKSLATSVETKMILWAEDEAFGEVVAALLSPQLLLEVVKDLPKLDAEGAQPLEEVVLLVCCEPVDNLCQAVRQDSNPEEVLVQWEAQMQAVLALQRRNRGRVRILNAGTIGREPEAFLRHYGVTVTKDAVAQLSTAVSDDEVLTALVQASLLADIGIRSLVAEFRTASVRFCAEGTDAMSAAVLLQACVQRQEDLHGLGLLENQQRSMYEQTEKLYTEKLLLEQRLDQMRQGLDSYEVQADKYQPELSKLREQLADKENALRDTEPTIQNLEGEVAALKEENNRILGSRSVRMMAPLRRLRSLLLGRGQT